MLVDDNSWYSHAYEFAMSLNINRYPFTALVYNKEIGNDVTYLRSANYEVCKDATSKYFAAQT